ncbi:alpha-mannosidase 2x-like isoform X2 [Mya arenaria]|nr:alpha-mannosidase 2x-like isoform X2 [Mya arenaria]
MGFSQQIPWRKVKLICLVSVLVIVMHILWTFTATSLSEDPAMEVRRGRPDSYEVNMHGHIFPSIEKTKVVQQYCKKVDPIRGVISTYDLPEETDYSLNTNGKYPIPQELYEADKNGTVDDQIEVILVPFSHADPGYGMTFEGYYTQRFVHVFSNMVDYLTSHGNMTFQWAETVYLERWFREINDEMKKKVRELIRRGQLEIVLGGWVMPDEASTHYQPVVDQLIEGHQWLQENLGVTPTNAWINDPFGYSSTMPYLWKKSGIDNMVILRIHQAIKSTIIRKRGMDFMWRPYWNSNNNNDILTNLMPYFGYWPGDVCGPDPSICSQFNFLHLPSTEAKPVTDQNVHELSEKLYKTYRFTSRIYQYKTLVMFLGEDASYDNRNAFKDVHENFGKLINYINGKPEWKMNVRFGTIRDYFEKVRRNEKEMKTVRSENQFPVISGDFFPYSDYEHDVWTGYFTTRIWMKRFTREIEPVIRAADVYSVIMYYRCIVGNKCGTNVNGTFNDVMKLLREARREVGMFQHHDGITGTSLPFVVNDYEERLQRAFRSARSALATTVSTLLSGGRVTSSQALMNVLEKQNAKTILGLRELKLKPDGMKLVVANSVVRNSEDVVNFLLTRDDIVILDAFDRNVNFQVSEPPGGVHRALKMISFKTALSPYELKTFTVKLSSDKGQKPARTNTLQGELNSDEPKVMTIANKYIEVKVNALTGNLVSIKNNNGKTTTLRSSFMKYKPDKSGAYLFGPFGQAEPISPIVDGKPTIQVVRGEMFSEIRVSHKSGFEQRFTVYNVDDIKGTGLYITNEITMRIEPSLKNAELIMRFETDIENGNILYTDQNGFQLMGRKTYSNMTIEMNYYPISTMAVIEDSARRLTVHAGQSHGVASLREGWLEVMLDRNVQRDDKKGLGQGVNEMELVLTEFVIQVEHKSSLEPVTERRYTYPSINSLILNEKLQNKVHAFSIEHSAGDFHTGLQTFSDILSCNDFIVGLRMLLKEDLSPRGISLVLHRKSSSCLFPKERVMCSTDNVSLHVDTFLSALNISKTLTRSVAETSLSHLHTLKTLDFGSDIRPQQGELRSFVITPANAKSTKLENKILQES